MTPLERAGLAVIKADAAAIEDEVEPTSQNWALLIARAVLLAIREPILSAIHDKADLVSGSDLQGRGFNRGVYASEDAVKAMIDKALEEG